MFPICICHFDGTEGVKRFLLRSFIISFARRSGHAGYQLFLEEGVELLVSFFFCYFRCSVAFIFAGLCDILNLMGIYEMLWLITQLTFGIW